MNYRAAIDVSLFAEDAHWGSDAEAHCSIRMNYEIVRAIGPQKQTL